MTTTKINLTLAAKINLWVFEPETAAFETEIREAIKTTGAMPVVLADTFDFYVIDLDNSIRAIITWADNVEEYKAGALRTSDAKLLS